jgi:beta-lactamase class C
MKILKKNSTKKIPTPFSVQRIAQAIALSLASLLLAAQVSAQNEKQISYPVAVPIERPAVAEPAPAAPVYKAPEPVIRPVEDAASTPPPVRKAKTTKKVAAENPDPKPVKAATTKKTNVKTTSKPVMNKKTVATKPVTNKSVTSKTDQKTTVKKNSVVTQKKTLDEAAAPTLKPVTSTTKEVDEVSTDPLLLNAVASTETKLPSAAAAVENNYAPQAKTLGAALAVTELATNSVAPDEEQLLANSLSEEGETFSEEAEPDAAVIPSPQTSLTPTTVATSSAQNAAPVVVKNIPLPMAAAREAYIAEFKTYVETKLVPRVPGLAVAVIADGKVKVLQAYGVKKIGGADAINTDTAFRLASVSKTIAGTAAGVLVNDGLINWDTPITSVLPNVEFSNPRYGNQLTLRNIMSQSTGLPTHSGDNYIEEGLPFDEVVGKLKSVNFVCPPGKCYSYQNVTLSLLGSIVLKKTGKTYEQYVKEKLFAPLGMRSASVGLEGLLATKNYALPHEVNGRGQWYTKEITQNYYRLNPAAGGNASITDMAHWVLAQMGHNPDVLSPLTLQAIHAKVTKNTAAQSHYGARDGVTDTHYGMGWRTFDYRGDKNFLHHGGYVFGSRSEMVFNPELQIGMVILSNCNRLPGEIIFKFLDAYEDEKRGERTIVPLPAAIKKRAAKK